MHVAITEDFCRGWFAAPDSVHSNLPSHCFEPRVALFDVNHGNSIRGVGRVLEHIERWRRQFGRICQDDVAVACFPNGVLIELLAGEDAHQQHRRYGTIVFRLNGELVSKVEIQASGAASRLPLLLQRSPHERTDLDVHPTQA